MTSRSRLAETAAWFDALYGHCRESDGSIVIVQASRNRLAGVYPIGDGGRLVEAARAAQLHPGCYVKINLMDAAAMQRRAKGGRPVVGRRDEVKSIVSVHLDVDAGKNGKYVSRNHALWAIEAMPLAPSLIVNSKGMSGGFHAYWLLQRPHWIESAADRQRCQTIANGWNKRLKALCMDKLDSTSNLDRVLRCVGVPRADGVLVTAYEYWPERLYELEDFCSLT